MPKTQMDFLANGMQQGEVANQMSGEGKMDVGMMRPFIGNNGRAYVSVYKGAGDRTNLLNYKAVEIRTNATLRKDEWLQLDQAVLAISESRLGGVKDLIDNGLTFKLGNAMGTTVLEYQDVSDALEAELTMDGIPRAKNDRPNYTSKYLPIPIIHSDYEINLRALSASRKQGNPLDSTLAERAARKVNEKLENLLFASGTAYRFGGGYIYSYLNHPSRNAVTITSWTASAKTSKQIIDDVLSFKNASIAAKHFGPWKLYIPTGYEIVLDQDYDTQTPGTTIRERIMKIAGIKGIMVVDTLPADNVAFVQMTQDVVRLVQGLGIQNVEWKTEGNFISNNKVLTIQVPQVRADQDGNSGVVHGSV